MNGKQPIPDWLLERFRQRELPPEQMTRLESLIASSPEAQERLAALERSDREILSRYPAEQMAAEIERRAAALRERAPTHARSRRLTWLAIPALAAALLVFVLAPWRLLQGPAEGGDGTHTKGVDMLKPILDIFRKKADSNERLQNGSLARTGDLIQLVYGAGDASDGVILSIDGKGAVTLHFPERADQKTALRQGRRFFLPTAYELDDAPSFERFIFITAKSKIPVAWVLDKARQLASSLQKAMTMNLDLPAEFGQCSVLIRKEK